MIAQLTQVGIADDHLLFRQILKKALLENLDILIKIEASNNDELLRKISRDNCDILLIDVFMPGLSNCLQTIKEILRINAQIKIIVVTMTNDEKIWLQLYHIGVFRIVYKGEDFKLLLDIIKEASSNVSQKDFNSNHVPMRKEDFSEREIAILKLISIGKSNKEIAKFCFLSVRSIEQIRLAMRERFKLKSIISLIAVAIENRII